MTGFETGPSGASAPGWWQASDGKWYPPEQAPGAISPPSGPFPYPYGALPPGSASNGLAIAALVLGIAAIVTSWLCGIGAVAGVLAVVFGIIGLKRADALPGRPAAGMAVAGIVTGAIGAVLATVFTVLIVVGVIFDRDGEPNSDPVNGWCNPERYWQDPDC